MSAFTGAKIDPLSRAKNVFNKFLKNRRRSEDDSDDEADDSPDELTGAKSGLEEFRKARSRSEDDSDDEADDSPDELTGAKTGLAKFREEEKRDDDSDDEDGESVVESVVRPEDEDGESVVEPEDESVVRPEVGPAEAIVASSTSENKTTATCAGDNHDYHEGKPIVSITFSLSNENPFQVNVGTSITSYKRSDKLAYPVLCEIRDFTGDPEKPVIIPLKNKACIEKNLPKVLATALAQLNELLLDEYTAYYDTTKYGAFIEKQKEFLTPAEETTSVEEAPAVAPVEDTTRTEEQRKRREAIEKLIQKLKEISEGTITNVDDERLSVIARRNAGVDIDKLMGFLSEKSGEVFPLHLLSLTYSGQEIFMTNNGIVTNGNVIFSYNDISIEKRTVSGTFEELGMWTLYNEDNYNKAVKALSGEVYEDGYIRQDILDKQDFIKGGTRRTLSQKLFKHRITKRIRK